MEPQKNILIPDMMKTIYKEGNSMNEVLKKEIKKVYPEMVVDWEFEGEVQFYTSPAMAEKGDDTYLRCGYFKYGKLQMPEDW